MNEHEKTIKKLIYNSLSCTNETIFEKLCDLFKTSFEQPVHNIIEMRKRTTKSKGTLFEVFCVMYLRSKGYEVWMLEDVPQPILEHVCLPRFDFGIDLIARIKIPTRESNELYDYFYFPVQCKYRKPTKDRLGRMVHRVGWKDISTFLSLCTRSGPKGNQNTKGGWLKHIIMTNAESVCWRGTKTTKDWTIAKKSFEKMSKFGWMKLGNLLEHEGTLLSTKENKGFEIEDVIVEVGRCESYRHLKDVLNESQTRLEELRGKRCAWLERVKI